MSMSCELLKTGMYASHVYLTNMALSLHFKLYQ